MEPPKPTGLIVVRAWLEDAGKRGLRARITHTLDLSRRYETVVVVATPEDVYAIVRSWLEAFMASRPDHREGKDRETEP